VPEEVVIVGRTSEGNWAGVRAELPLVLKGD
jgi:hypothetical protein